MKCSSFKDDKGFGWFASRFSKTGHLLVALRLTYWRIDYVDDIAKPNYRRLYIGPFEFEWSRLQMREW